MIRRVVVFGASGDLAGRYLLPAVARLREAGELPGEVELRGVALKDWNTDAFRRHVAEALERHGAGVSAATRQALAAQLTYWRADVGDPDDVVRALNGIAEPLVAYLALPPGLFAPAIEALGARGLPGGSRIVVEKPFGESRASAEQLNRLLHARFSEDAVFRMDHFLGKQTVQNILGLRCANRLFEPLWNCHHIEQVAIVWDETVTAAGRAGYYDRSGALRDMIQNHLLQLLALVTMEVPRSLGARDLRDRKVDAFRAVRRLTPDDVVRHTVRARYGSGRIDDRELGAYVDEPGVDAARQTETYARVTLTVDNWRWAGVPFVLQTGKALRRRRREIAVRFREVPHLAFGQHAGPVPNELCLALDPDRVALRVNINGPGDPFELEPVELDVTLAPQALPAYARLLLDVLRGEAALSIRSDEAEEAWAIVEPILQGWTEGAVPLTEYPAGSDGP